MKKKAGIGIEYIVGAVALFLILILVLLFKDIIIKELLPSIIGVTLIIGAIYIVTKKDAYDSKAGIAIFSIMVVVGMVLFSIPFLSSASRFSIFSPSSGKFSIITDWSDVNFNNTKDISLNIIVNWYSGSWVAWVTGASYLYVDDKYISTLGSWDKGYGNGKGSNIPLLNKEIILNTKDLNLKKGVHTLTIRVVNAALNDIPERGTPKPTEQWQSCVSQANQQSTPETNQWIDILASCLPYEKTDISDIEFFNINQEDIVEPPLTWYEKLWKSILAFFKNMTWV